MRVAIYARYSSDNQRKESIDDQIEDCRRYAECQGWTVQKAYSDAAQSGADKFRYGFQQMLVDARAGKFDLILFEHLDRLARHLTDTSATYDELNFLKIGLHSISHGQITPMHIAMIGAMAEMALTDLRDKTRRGQAGRVRDGKIPSGVA